MPMHNRTVDVRITSCAWTPAVGLAALTVVTGLAGLPATADDKAQPPKDVAVEKLTADPAGVEAIKAELAAAAKAGDLARVRALADKLEATAGRRMTVVGDQIDRVMPEVRANGFAIVGRSKNGYYAGWPATGVQVNPRLWVAGPDVSGWRRAVEGLKRAKAEMKDKPEALAVLDTAIARYERRLAAGVWAVDGVQPFHPRAVAQVGPIPPMPAALAIPVDRPPTWVTAGERDATVAAVRQKLAATMANYEKQVADLNGQPDAQAAVRRAMAEYEGAMTSAVTALGCVAPRLDRVRVVEGVAGAGERVRLGIQPERIPDVVLAQVDVPVGQGVMIAQVLPGSPADKVGLRSNDILLMIGGTAMPADPDAVAGVVRELKSGEPLDVTVLRKGKAVTLKGLTLSEATKP